MSNYTGHYSWEDNQGWIRYGTKTEEEAKLLKNATKYNTAWEAQNYADKHNMIKVNNIGKPEALAEGKKPLTIDGAETK